MHVNKLRLLGVKPLWQEIPGRGRFPDAAQRRLLLQGANGSGKTTVLESIFLLWRHFGEWIDASGDFTGNSPPSRSFLIRSELAAAEFAGVLPDAPSLWIGIGRRPRWNELKEGASGNLYAGLVHEPNDRWTIEMPHGDWKAIRNLSLLGKQQRANVVYVPPERQAAGQCFRGIRPAQVIDTTGFQWAARYNPRVRFEDVLLTVQVLDAAGYNRFLELVNLALRPAGKEILGFGETGHLRIAGTRHDGTRFVHYIDQLSSGEKQMLVMIGFTIAFLRQGGILIIDEPDLHIHALMMTQVMQSIDFVVQERQGQLIVASHSEIVWDFFSRSTERIELSPWREEKHELTQIR